MRVNEKKKEKKDQGFDLPELLNLASGLDNNLVPLDDSKDVQAGATSIPYEVTDLRRAKKKVKYLGDNRWEYDGRIIA